MKLINFYVMFEGRQIGTIKAKNYEEARNRTDEVITIEQEEGDEGV